MAPPTGGPPVARGDAFIVPKAPRTKRRGNPQTTERTRDMDKVRKLKEQADREAQEAEARHPEPVATFPGDETSPCRVTHFADDNTKQVVYEVTRRDLRTGAAYGDTVNWTFGGFNGMVESQGSEGVRDIILGTLRVVDESLLHEMNAWRRDRGLPVLRHAMSRWQDPFVLANPPLSQATKKVRNAPVTQEMIEDDRVTAFQSTLVAMNRGYISKDEAKKRLQNITDA